jgi:hypothetical protein
MLVNVPAFASAAAIEFTCNGISKGACQAAELGQLLRRTGYGPGR